jgi:rhamnose transport system permease protein
MTLARFGTITVENAIGLELQVVAAVVVGGVNVFGGSGTVIGAMLGAVLIGTLEQSLFRLQISQFWLDALLGLLILLAVASDTLILRRLRALWARTELRLVAEAAPEAGERRAVGSDAQARASAGSVLKGG